MIFVTWHTAIEIYSDKSYDTVTENMNKSVLSSSVFCPLQTSNHNKRSQPQTDEQQMQHKQMTSENNEGLSGFPKTSLQHQNCMEEGVWVKHCAKMYTCGGCLKINL